MREPDNFKEIWKLDLDHRVILQKGVGTSFIVSAEYYEGHDGWVGEIKPETKPFPTKEDALKYVQECIDLFKGGWS